MSGVCWAEECRGGGRTSEKQNVRLDLYAHQVLRDLGLSLVGSFLTAWALTAGGAAPESASAALWAIRAQPPPGPPRGPHQTCSLSPHHVWFFPPPPKPGSSHVTCAELARHGRGAWGPSDFAPEMGVCAQEGAPSFLG